MLIVSRLVSRSVSYSHYQHLLCAQPQNIRVLRALQILLHPDGRASMPHVCVRDAQDESRLCGSLLTDYCGLTSSDQTSNQSIKGGQNAHGSNIAKLTYHVHSICKNKRLFEARFVSHHDHCAPLHAAASLPSFKTLFHIRKILRVHSCGSDSQGTYFSAQDVTVTCWMRMLCGAFTCSRKYWNLGIRAQNDV